MKNFTHYDTFLMHLECTIENVGVNAIKHQDQEKVHEESKKAVEFITATLERQKEREGKTIKIDGRHEPNNEAQSKPCNIYGVSQRSELKPQNKKATWRCDECDLWYEPAVECPHCGFCG